MVHSLGRQILTYLGKSIRTVRFLDISWPGVQIKIKLITQHWRQTLWPHQRAYQNLVKKCPKIFKPKFAFMPGFVSPYRSAPDHVFQNSISATVYSERRQVCTYTIGWFDCRSICDRCNTCQCWHMCTVASRAQSLSCNIKRKKLEGQRSKFEIHNLDLERCG